MKTRNSLSVAIALALVIGAPAHGQTAPAMPIPTVTARSSAISKKILRTNTATTKTAQDSRAVSVAVNVTFLTNPPQPYEVQCFFIAKNERTQERSIFDAASEASQGKIANFAFDSQTIAGGSSTWTSTPFSGSVSGYTNNGTTFAGTFAGNNNNASFTSGSRIDGWVVRVVSEGKILNVQSNQPTLLDVAKTAPKLLDDAAAKIKKRPD